MQILQVKSTATHLDLMLDYVALMLGHVMKDVCTLVLLNPYTSIFFILNTLCSLHHQLTSSCHQSFLSSTSYLAVDEFYILSFGDS